MSGIRVSLASLFVAVLVCGILLAGLRSGSVGWFFVIYNATFVLLLFAALAARWRSAFWYGFAVLAGATSWSGLGRTRDSPQGTINHYLPTSTIQTLVARTLTDTERPISSSNYRVRITNRCGIGHCALTILFALCGGLIAIILDRKASRSSSPAPESRSE